MALVREGYVFEMWKQLPPKEDDVDHWLRLAEQARLRAGPGDQCGTKREMLTIAPHIGDW